MGSDAPPLPAPGGQPQGTQGAQAADQSPGQDITGVVDANIEPGQSHAHCLDHCGSQGSAPAQAIPAAKAAQVWPDGKEFGSAEVSRGIRPSTIT